MIMPPRHSAKRSNAFFQSIRKCFAVTVAVGPRPAAAAARLRRSRSSSRQKACCSSLWLIGAIPPFHKDVEAQVEHWIDLVRISPDNRLCRGAARKTERCTCQGFSSSVSMRCGWEALALQKRWAEYLTIIATGLFCSDRDLCAVQRASAESSPAHESNSGCRVLSLPRPEERNKAARFAVVMISRRENLCFSTLTPRFFEVYVTQKGR